MNFLRKHSLWTVIFSLVIISLGLYLFLAKPIMVRRQEAAETMEEKFIQLRIYRDDPPSSEMVNRLSYEKERLGKQYEEVVKILNFSQRMLLPEDPGDPLFLDEQIDKFERQIEKTEDELGRLAERTGINIPERLGFGRERPESREELSLLLSQLALVRELVILIIETGVGELSLLNPLSSYREEVAALPRERREMPPEMMMEMPPGFEFPLGIGVPERQQRIRPVEKDRFTQVLGLEKLKFELEVRTEILALTNLLHQIANHFYFFTVQDLEIRSVRVERERAFPEVREREERRRRRVPRMMEMPPEVEFPLRREPGEIEEPDEEVGRELEVRLIVTSRLASSHEEEKNEVYPF